MTRPITGSKGALRALTAYRELTDAADSFYRDLSHQTHRFGLTMPQFRVLELLHHEGPKSHREIAAKLCCGPRNVTVIVNSLERHRWVRRERPAGPGLTGVGSRVHEARGAAEEPATDRRVVYVHLTPSGEKVIERVFPSHVKVIKAEMRVLTDAQQNSIIFLCRKLRRGDILKFIRDITMPEREEIR
jgi:MarR family 2-MHQ and catechol resistance regulon transcriptional repressor